MNRIIFGVSPSFVSPFYPVLNSEVAFKCIIPKKSNIKWIKLCYIKKDFISREELKKVSDNLYSVSIKITEEYLRFWFEYRTSDGSTYYYDTSGENKAFNSWKNAFVLKSDLCSPTWISNSICYQIFPDRFCNFRKDLGVKTGDYEFNGGVCKARNWDDEVLPYSEGRCIDFYNGDLYGIAEKIPHLKELGVTCVYLNPIFSSCTVHRFDCIDYFNVDEKLGGNEAYIYLINKMHENGIRVICDVSINHTGSNHPWFKNAQNGGEYVDFYYKKDNGDFIYWANVDTLPQLNYNSEALRNIIYKDSDSVLKKYLKEPFNQDGWRLDVANEVGNTEDDFLCHQVWKEVRKELKKEKEDVYLVGEDWEDSSVFLDGTQWDATMNYISCSRPIRRWMGERDVYATSRDVVEAEEAFSAYEMAQSLNNALSPLVSQMLYLQMNLIDSHDISRLHNDKKIFNKDVYFGCLILQYLLPGMPSIYYGDEVALPGPVGTVEGCRYPMEWDSSKWDMDFYNFYKKLYHMRTDYENVIKNGYYGACALSDDVLVFTRYTDNEELTLILNKSKVDKRVSLDRVLYLSDLNNTDKKDSESKKFSVYDVLNKKKKIGSLLSLKANKSVLLYSKY